MLSRIVTGTARSILIGYSVIADFAFPPVARHSRNTKNELFLFFTGPPGVSTQAHWPRSIWHRLRRPKLNPANQRSHWQFVEIDYDSAISSRASLHLP